MKNDILTLREVSKYLKLAEKTTYRLVAKGVIPGFKIGGSWRFKQKEIEMWLENQRNN